MNRLHILLFTLAFLSASCSPTALPTVEATPTRTTLPPTDTPQPTHTPTPVVTPTAPPASPTPVPTTLTPTSSPIAAHSPTPVPPATPIYGLVFSPISEGGGLNLVRQTRSTWVRNLVIRWGAVEPTPGERRWGTLADAERQWLRAAEAGLTPIAIIMDTPFWAQAFKGIPCGPIDPAHLDEFGAFMHDLVARYSVPPYGIQYWEIWNEPDIGLTDVPPDSGYGCWGDPDDPDFGGGAYGEMLKVVYPQVKAADPDAQLMVGGLLLDCDPVDPPVGKDCTPARFLTGILESGAGPYFDGISFHAYDFYAEQPGMYGNLNWHSAWDSTGPVLITKTRFLRSLLDQYGYPEKFLTNTELGLLCGRGGNEPPCRTQKFEDTKAAYLAQSYAAAKAEGLLANIWYSLRGWRGSGLVRSDLQPRPAFRAYQFSAALLSEAVFLGEQTSFPGVKGYQFAKEGETIWFLWSLDGETHTVKLPASPTAVYDVYGENLLASMVLEISLAPRYIVWEE